MAFPTGQLTEDEEEGTPSASPQAVSRMGEVEPQQGPSSRELTREEGTETREDGPTKLSPTLWEDELTVVYQVQVGGQCVARRAGQFACGLVQGRKKLISHRRRRRQRPCQLHQDAQRLHDDSRQARRLSQGREGAHSRQAWNNPSERRLVRPFRPCLPRPPLLTPRSRNRLPLNRAIALAELHQSTHLFSPLFAPDIRPLLFRPENLDRTISLVKAARQRQILSSPPPFDLPNGVARKQALTTYFEEVVTTIEERFPGAFLEQREAVTSRSDGGGAELEGEMTRTGPRIPLRRERAVSSSTSEASSRRSSNPFSESIASSTSSTSMSSLSNFTFETMGTSLQDSWESQEVETIDSAFEETSELDDVYRPMPGSPVRRPVLRRDRRHSFPTQPLSYVPIPISSASVNMQTRHSVDNTAFPPYANHPLHPPQLSTFEQKYISSPGGSSFYLPSTLQHQQHQHLLPPSQQQQQQQQRYPQHFAPSRQDALTTAPFPSPDDLYSPSSYSSQSFFSPPTYEPTPTPYSSPPLANTPPPFSSSQYAFPDAPYDYFAHTGYSYLSDFAPTSYAPPPAGRRLASPVERRDSLMGAVLEAPVERGTKAGEKGRERWGSVESEGGAVKKAKGEGAERMRRCVCGLFGWGGVVADAACRASVMF